MAACDDKPWTMTLVTLNDGEPTELEFRDIKISLGRITGYVYLEEKQVSPLTGTCRPLVEKLTQMEFQFTLDTVVIFLSGVAVEPLDSNILFFGGFRAFEAASRGSLPVALKIPDPGDTGTGNGMQAQQK